MKLMPEMGAILMDGESGNALDRCVVAGDAVIHQPVMLREVLDAFAPLSDKSIIDATFGAGGYSRAMLERGAVVYGNDRDPFAQRLAAQLAHDNERFHVVKGPFSGLENHFQSGLFPQVDGLVADLGVSSMQLDQCERGFSFRQDGPLDMRMSQSGETAADIVNTYDEKPLADIIYQYGEERYSRRIAKAVIRERSLEPITTTARLADIVRGAVPPAVRYDRIHPATKTFQALRILVNDELGEVETLLQSAPKLLKPGGRLVIVAFHSLEDRLVKKCLTASQKQPVNRHMPDMDPSDDPKPSMTLLTKRAVLPRQDEIEQNPRARSARLRIAVKPLNGES